MEKFKTWLATTGLTNVGWAAGFIGGIILGWNIAAGVCLGIFATHNFVVIKNLINGIKK